MNSALPRRAHRASPRKCRSRAKSPRPICFQSPTPAEILYPSLPMAGRTLQFYSFDAKYVEDLCAGDFQTQQHFVAYFTALLKIKLRSRLQSFHAIDDACQETFARVLQVLRRDGGLRQPESLGAFVNNVCNHVLFEHYRSSSRSESLDAEGAPEPAATGADVLDIVSARQIKENVLIILMRLSKRDRSLLKAVFLDERDRDEVCQEFGVEREYLRVLLHRAKQEFKVEYVKHIGDQVSLSADT
jgi:RNA polymerase sigma-70 factor, ECF subfamily